jgi:branched-chain amino acid transport system permease protein
MAWAAQRCGPRHRQSFEEPTFSAGGGAPVSFAVLGSGILNGLVLALVAVGFTVIFNSTGIVNFANGEFMVVGAYVAYTVSVTHGLAYYWAAVVGVAAGALMGLVTDRLVIGPVRRANLLVQILALLALSDVVDGALQQIYGGSAEIIPPYASTRKLVPKLDWSKFSLIIIVVTIIVLAAIFILVNKTSFGVSLRAVSDNSTGASLVGADPAKLASASWAIGGGAAALAGLLIIPTGSLEPTAGSTLTFLAFGAVVLGGFGSLTGALVGGLIIGILQAIVVGTISDGYGPFVSLAAMIIVLTVRPQGLLGART